MGSKANYTHQTEVDNQTSYHWTCDKEYADNLPTGVTLSISPFWHYHFTFLQKYGNFLEDSK